MSKRHNIPEGTLRWHAHKEQWMVARTNFQAKVEDKLVAAAASKDVVAKLRDINTAQMRWNEEMRYAINSLLKVRTEDGKIVLRSDVDLADIQRAIAGMSELYRLDRLALGASTDNVAPATTRDRIDEMSDDEVMAELHRMRARTIEATVN
jgi:hypothetical protein